MRHFLYTWVHEAGHAFNMLHSWDKNRSDSLSWMNYDWKYNSLDSDNDFWNDFEFRFDDEELIHLRHGNRSSVIMGGDQWASGGHLDAPTESFSNVIGEAPVELLLRSKGYHDLLSPVAVEVRLRNRLKDIDIDVDGRLDPTFGGLKFLIKKPDGTTVMYEPIACQIGTPELITLTASNKAKEGEDRYSESVFLQFGADGFYFDAPGDYLVRALYTWHKEITLSSNTIKLRIGTPHSRNEDILAQDFFTRDVGMCLWMQGSQSSYLSRGMDTLKNIMDEFQNTAVQARIGSIVTGSIGSPFFGIKDIKKSRKIEKLQKGDPKEALGLTNAAVEFYEKYGQKNDNIDFHALVSKRVEMHKMLGDEGQAKKERDSLIKFLKQRGVKQAVTDTIKKDL